MHMRMKGSGWAKSYAAIWQQIQMKGIKVTFAVHATLTQPVSLSKMYILTATGHYFVNYTLHNHSLHASWELSPSGHSVNDGISKDLSFLCLHRPGRGNGPRPRPGVPLGQA